MTEAKQENKQNLAAVQDNIADIAKIAGRDSRDVQLIAVSKTRSTDEIKPLLSNGHRVFGENRVQEAADKWPALKSQFPDTRLHLIGQLQSNKAKEAAALFDVIHSVDRLSLIKALGKAVKEAGRNIPCFLQVNIGAEEQKGGCDIADIPALLNAARQHGVNIVGLMCLPPANLEAAPYFALLCELASRNGLAELSMGMSADYETAIRMGSTYIRVGTALFGPRQ